MTIDPLLSFKKETKERILLQGKNKEIQELAKNFTDLSHKLKYSYNFSWLGRPIIQYPQDIVAVQEIIYKVKPDLIIETGVAHGGSLILSASLLSLLDVMSGKNPKKSKSKVIGIDIDIRSHNRKALDNHPLRNKIHLIEGSSISEDVITQVNSFAKNYKNILVFLDSNHSHKHVIEELNAYTHLVSKDSYCIVFDTLIENFEDKDYFNDRPWGIGDSPMSALEEWLPKHQEFLIDKEFDNKLLISVSPNGFLKRIH